MTEPVNNQWLDNWYEEWQGLLDHNCGSKDCGHNYWKDAKAAILSKLETLNNKTPVGVSSSDKFSYLHNIINQYEIKHPKPSISKNTAKKMLIRDLDQAITAKLESIEQAYKNVDRLEVIDETGRAYVRGSIYGIPVKIELSYQDNGKTLKVFVEELHD